MAQGAVRPVKSMTRKNFKIENSEPTFPEGSSLIIEKILEKYGLQKKQEEGIEKIFLSQAPEERREIFENLPGSKISRLVREYAFGKISLKDMPSIFKKELNITEEKAQEIVKELEKNLLSFIKIKPEKEKELPKTSPIKPKPPIIPAEKPDVPPKPEAPKKPDIYREPIE